MTKNKSKNHYLSCLLDSLFCLGVYTPGLSWDLHRYWWDRNNGQ